jgi:hypothetical protein
VAKLSGDKKVLTKQVSELKEALESEKAAVARLVSAVVHVLEVVDDFGWWLVIRRRWSRRQVLVTPNTQRKQK